MEDLQLVDRPGEQRPDDRPGESTDGEG
jgi:hypothetical protein